MFSGSNRILYEFQHKDQQEETSQGSFYCT